MDSLVRTGVLDQPCPEVALLLGEVQVAHMMEGAHLLGDGLLEALITMTQAAGGNTSDKVQVLLPGGIEEPAAFAPAIPITRSSDMQCMSL